MAVKTDNLILTAHQIDQKIQRISYEIYEKNFQEKEIFLAGVKPKGIKLAKKLAKKLEEISPLNVTLIEVELDKANPAKSDIQLNVDTKTLRNKVVILVDDVLNTGKTFAYSMRPFLSVKVSKMEVAVLVNRSHTQFPIHSNYTGYEVSTTINEHIDVILTGKEKGVYLV